MPKHFGNSLPEYFIYQLCTQILPPILVSPFTRTQDMNPGSPDHRQWVTGFTNISNQLATEQWFSKVGSFPSSHGGLQHPFEHLLRLKVSSIWILYQTCHVPFLAFASFGSSPTFYDGRVSLSGSPFRIKHRNECSSFEKVHREMPHNHISLFQNPFVYDQVIEKARTLSWPHTDLTTTELTWLSKNGQTL